MKTKLLLTLSLFCVFSVIAQFAEQQIISTTTEKPYLSMPFDIDNDGFMDILTASGETYKMSWYRNLDGAGNFGDEIIFNGVGGYFLSIEFVDIDTDGDKDILYLVNNPRQAVWIENLDGAGSFGTPQIILEQDFIGTITTFDIDNDGDPDLIVEITDTYTGWIVWYENLDGQGTFGTENLLIENNDVLFTFLLVDIDTDGKKDILAVDESYNPSAIFWYKNMGDTSFGAAQIIYQFQTLLSDWTSINDLQVADINTDGKEDIIIYTNHDYYGIFVYWLENLDNQGNFGDLQLIMDTNVQYLFYDLDNDSDNDMLLWNRYTDKISWKENEDGQGSFGTPKNITSEVDFVSDAKAADFNGDGWLDVTSASRGDNKIAWYKNITLNISESEASNFIIYPNPTNGILNIKSDQPFSKISVYNILGQRIETTSENNQIDLSKAESGVYILKIEDESGNFQTFKVLRQ